MLIKRGVHLYFWAEIVAIAYYIMNQVFLSPLLEKIPYELFKNRKPNILYFHVFGCKCYNLKNANDSVCKFDQKVDEGIFLG